LARESFKTGWLTIDQSSDPDYFVRLMDMMRGGNDDDPVQYRTVFDLLDVQDGEHVLDVGCGTGGAVRALAPHVGSAGRVVGVDLSATMIAEATKRANGSELPVEFHIANAHRLPFADNAFDRSYALRVFEIIDMPRDVLAEMVRVTRSGGPNPGKRP
jgi:ubiquinone/menaquinone biosynthesis C-methylase UbiE